MGLTDLVNYFISLLVICSPFSALPALLTLTQGLSDEEKRRTGVIAGMGVGIILIVVTWIGGPALNFLGITVPAFQVAGGFVVFMLALSMLNAETSRMKQTTEDQKQTKEDQKVSKQRQSIAIVPLAIPIMAGPGAISTVIVTVNNNPGALNQLFLSLCAVLVAFVLGVTLYFSTNFEKVVGQRGINVVNRLAGLILAGMAVQTLSRGIIGLFPFMGQQHLH
jgi:multiple antibiotic resistance protein